jgi:hypothetical protein
LYAITLSLCVSLPRTISISPFSYHVIHPRRSRTNPSTTGGCRCCRWRSMTQEGTTNTTKRTTMLIGSSRFLPFFFFCSLYNLDKANWASRGQVEDDKLLAYWTSPVYLPVMASLLMLVSLFQGWSSASVTTIGKGVMVGANGHHTHPYHSLDLIHMKHLQYKEICIYVLLTSLTPDVLRNRGPYFATHLVLGW